MATKKAGDIDDVLNVIGDLTKMFSDRFDKVDERFDKVDDRFDKVDERFDKVEMQLFNQGEDTAELKSDMSDVKTKVDHIYSVLDAHMKRIEDILQENQIRDHQQERMERWIFQLADEAGIKLKYEQS